MAAGTWQASMRDGGRPEFDRLAQLKFGLLLVLFIGVFWELLDFVAPRWGQLVHAWLHEPDWSHGPLIPLFSAYLVYQRWDEIRKTPVRQAWVGLPIMVGGFLLYVWSLSGLLAFGYAQPLGLMITLLGTIIFLCGVPNLRYLGVPWLFLFFAIPMPQRLYFELTDPLRRMAATVAAAVLNLSPHLDVWRLGSNLEYSYHPPTPLRPGLQHEGVIGVADACSGMRSTVTLCALGVAVAFMSERPMWHRLVLVAACVPIATFCNFIRVTVTCWLHVFVDPKYASGTYHTMLGLLVIGLAFAIFAGLGRLLDVLFVEEEVDDEATPAKTDS